VRETPNVLLDKTSTQHIISSGTGIDCNICANLKAGERLLIGENETRTQLTRDLTRWMSLVEQELFILPEQLRSPPFVLWGTCCSI
jgi:hypothetical protein